MVRSSCLEVESNAVRRDEEKGGGSSSLGEVGFAVLVLVDIGILIGLVNRIAMTGGGGRRELMEMVKQTTSNERRVLLLSTHYNCNLFL